MTTFQKVLNKLSRDAKSPLWICLVIQIFSNIQITSLILQPTLSSNNHTTIRVLGTIRSISAWTVGFSIYKLGATSMLLNIVWYTSMIYLITIWIITSYIVVGIAKGTKSYSRASKIIGIIHFIHSKILFAPIHYFLIWMISLQINCKRSKELSTLKCEMTYLVLMIFFAVLNFIMAFLKEVLLYQITRTKNPFSRKSNRYYQLLLIQKTIDIILIVLVPNSEAIVFALNLVFSLIYCLEMLTRLPFYHIPVLRTTLICATCHLSFSIFVFLTLSKSTRGDVEVILAFITILFTKTCLIWLNSTIKRILSMEFKTPYEAAHILSLLKNSTMEYSTVSVLKNKYSEGSFYFYGLLTHLKVDSTKLKDPNTLAEFNTHLYSVIVRRLNDLLQKYPKSELLILTIGHIYMRKMGNVSKAVFLLNQLKALGPSVQARNAIVDMYLRLEQFYLKKHPASGLAVFNYFNQRDRINMLRDTIQTEISLHLEYWTAISAENANVRLVSDLSDKINGLNHSVRKMWQDYRSNYDRNFVAPFLLYGIYLEGVRKSSHESTQLIKKYYDLKRNRLQVQRDGTENLFSQDVAIIIASSESERSGIIIDTSASVHSIFDIERERLLGQNIAMILPRFLVKKHDTLIRRFTTHDKQDQTRTIESFGKTLDGRYFPLKIEVKVHPFLDKGYNLIAHITKLKERELIMIVDHEDAIVDCSEELFEVFNLNKRDLDSTKVDEICPEMRDIGNNFERFYNDSVRDTYIENHESRMESFPYDDKTDTEYLRTKNTLGKNRGTLIKSFARLHSKNDQAMNYRPLASSTHTSQSDIKESPHRDKNTPFKYNKLVTLQSNKLSQDNVNNESSTATKKGAKQKNEDLCHKYTKGIRLKFCTKDSKGGFAEDKIEMSVNVNPYLVLGDLYKIIKFKDFIGIDKRTISYMDLPALEQSRNNSNSVASEDITFGEEFPTENERTFTQLDIPVEEQLTTKNMIPSIKVERVHSKLGKLKSVFERDLDNNVDHEASVKEHQRKATNQKAKNAALRRHVATSIQGHSSSGNYTAKVLNEIYDKEEIRPSTKFAVLLVYIAIFLVFVFISLFYVVSGSSFQTMNDGSVIIDRSSSRILDSMINWQYALAIYARSIKLRPISPLIGQFQTLMNTSSRNLFNENDELQNKIQEFGNVGVIRTFFARNLNLWVPYQNKTFSSGPIDSFSATTTLAQKNLAIANYQNSVLFLAGDEDMLFVMNNTSNDYLTYLQQQVLDSESLVQDEIESNQVLVTILLALEIVALVFVQISLGLVLKAILESYTKLFKVIIKIQPDKRSQRISELYSIQEFFTKNIEIKEFATKGELLVESTNKQSSVAHNKERGARFRYERFSTRQLTFGMAKFLLISFCACFRYRSYFLCVLFLIKLNSQNITT